MRKNHEIKTKAVAFNILDPDQLLLYEHVCKRKNISAYIKRLIQRDIEGYHAQPVQVQHVPKEKEEVGLNTDLMEGLI